MNYYLAVDIGASSGRHILSHIENGKLLLEEVYRFDNGYVSENGSLCWDIEALTENVIEGIKRCGELGKIPVSVAIDTWAVDYALLDGNRERIAPVYCYRDSRTEGVPEETEKIISFAELYSRTGIQKQNFNTIYQLLCDKTAGRLERADRLLMIPEYLTYKLTGVMCREYTNASTTALVDAKTKTWASDIIRMLGLPESLFPTICRPGEKVGGLAEEVRKKVGFNTDVYMCASHDTASAVAACPLQPGSVYISSGTWSLIGTELTEPVLTEEAMECNFTNEGGMEYRFRFLKNYMGMWLFQNIRKNLGGKISYDEMMHAAENSGYEKCFDVNDPSLTAPDNMTEAIRILLGEPGLPVEDVLKSTYLSLAQSYRAAIAEIERISGKTIDSVVIVGGGSKDRYLDELTAKYTGKKVYAGVKEATAVGNIAVQLIGTGAVADLSEARGLIMNSFEIREVTV